MLAPNFQSELELSLEALKDSLVRLTAGMNLQVMHYAIGGKTCVRLRREKQERFSCVIDGNTMCKGYRSSCFPCSIRSD